MPQLQMIDLYIQEGYITNQSILFDKPFALFQGQHYV